MSLPAPQPATPVATVKMVLRHADAAVIHTRAAPATRWRNRRADAHLQLRHQRLLGVSCITLVSLLVFSSAFSAAFLSSVNRLPPSSEVGLTGKPRNLRQQRLSSVPRYATKTRDRAGTVSPAVMDALNEFDGDFRAPFELLDITDPELPKADIRKAFRTIARKEHPDVSDHEDAEERFRRISLAYELLMDDGGKAMLMEAMERDVEELEDLEDVDNEMDEATQAWDKRWEEDEFQAVYRTFFLIFMFTCLGAVIWWWGFEHE